MTVKNTASIYRQKALPEKENHLIQDVCRNCPVRNNEVNSMWQMKVKTHFTKAFKANLKFPFENA